MDPVLLARANGLGRIGFGVGLLAWPRRLTQAWIGEDSGRLGAQVITRCLGMRDLVIGAGTLAAAGPDLTVTLAAGSALPQRGRVLVTVAAGAGVALGAAALAGDDH